MNVNKQKSPTPWPHIVLFLVISLSSIIAGSFYHNIQEKSLLSEKQLELSAISDLKIRQITQWRQERTGDGQFLGSNTFLVRRFSKFIKGNTNPQFRTNILQSLRSLTDNYDYKNVLLLDTSGKVCLSYPNQDTIVGDHLKPLIPDIVRQRKVVLTDLHQAKPVSFVHIDLIVPLIDSSVNDTLVLGLLAIRVDPQKILYPLIQTWPIASKSAESLIIRREGDQIVYLNELKFAKNSELTLKKQVAETKLPAVMALNGITGTLDGIDYRNVHVVASMKKIPGTSWYMVSKIDRDEVFSVLNEQMKMVNTIITLFILSIGFFLGFLWRNQRARFYREKYETELSRLALIKHFDYILKYANDIILLIDSDLNIVEANDRALETYQYSRDEMIGLNIEKIRTPESMLHLMDQLKNIEENKAATFEARHRRKDGTEFPVEISSRVVNIEGSKYYQTISRDITERKRAETTLKASEEKFRKIFEESPFPMLMTAKDFVITSANCAFCNIIGYSEEELKSFTFRNFTHPDYISENEISLMKLVSGEIPIYHTEKRYICKEGKIIWGSTTISIIHNEKNEVQFFLVMVEDITSRKESQSILDKSFSLVKATLESTADGLLVVDTDGKIVQFNQKFTEMWRIPEEVLDTGEDSEALGFVMSQLSDPESFMENVKHLYAEPESETSDLLEFKDGRYFERYSQPQKINGKSVGRVWSFRDITEKKKAEKDLIAAKEKAEESDRLKTAFLHNVSHEIRTPMNAIIGFTALLNESGLTEAERNQYAEIIFQSGNQLLSIINDIVDISNIETGQTKVNINPLNINLMLKSLNDQFSIKERSPEVVLNLKIIQNDNKPDLLTDGTKLIQVLSNLLNNAIKFTAKGSIGFGYQYKEGFVEFFVNDSGIGIPHEHHNKIFDRFYQVDGAISRQFGGTGLGLSICKAYVELLGGKIWFESEPGEGTSFFFTVPFTQATNTRQQTPDSYREDNGQKGMIL
jgi:PAS domain S-box-containing protein